MGDTWYVSYTANNTISIFRIAAGVQFNSKKFNSKKFIVSLSTNEYWTLIQVHNHKHDSGLGTTPRDISKLYFFRRLKTCWLRRHRNNEISSGDISRGLSHQSFELFNAKQNIPFILNETKGARSSDRAYVPQIRLSLFRHNTYDGVHKTKQNMLTTTSDHLWSLIIHRLHTYLGASRIIQKDILK